MVGFPCFARPLRHRWISEYAGDLMLCGSPVGAHRWQFPEKPETFGISGILYRDVTIIKPLPLGRHALCAQRLVAVGQGHPFPCGVANVSPSSASSNAGHQLDHGNAPLLLTTLPRRGCTGTWSARPGMSSQTITNHAAVLRRADKAHHSNRHCLLHVQDRRPQLFPTREYK